MKITVNKDNVKIEEFDIVHEGEHRVNKCSFSFSEEYTEDLVKKAIFTSQNSSIEVVIINNECDIPTEILKARNIVLLGVYAYKVVEDKLDLRYSPSPDAFKVNSGSYIEDASESEEITPTQFEQYMQALNNGLNKVEESLKKMDSATSSATQLVDDINQKLEDGDFIGPEGPQGVQGVPGKNGTDGADGADGVGVTTITSGQSTVEEDKTVTPVTVNKTDGSSQIFKVEAKNGLDGQNGINGQDGKDGKDGVNGQDGLTPTIGDNGNWFLGDTDTGKPSRGEVGPSPDLTDYVKNTDYANASKAGVLKINGNAARISSDGVLSAAEVSEEQYKTTVNSIFISKGTLDNVKNFLVESSTPVITLNNTLDNLVRKNRVSDYIISLKDALKYKVFEFLVHGKVKQETTTGKNLYNAEETYNWTSNIGWHFIDGSFGAQGTNIGDKTTLKAPVEQGVTYTFSVNTIISSPSESTQTPLRLVYGDESNIANVSDGNYSYTFTATKTGYILLRLYINEDNTTVTISNIQLEEGSTATSYEPYTGGQPSPSPDYPQEITTLTFDKITRRGKNYLNIEDGSQTINGVTVTKNNGKITLNGTATNICFFPISKSIDNFRPGKYVLSANNSKTLNNNQNLLRIMKEDNTGYLESTITNFSKINNTTIFNITADDDVNNTYLLLRIETGTVLDNFIFYPQLEQGSQATEYEPYQGQTYDIDLQGNEMVEIPNGVKDELVIDKEGNISLVKNVEKVILDGSIDFSVFEEDTENGINKYGNVLFVNYRILNEKPAVKPYTKYPTVISNYFKEIEENIWVGEKVAIDVDNYQLIFVVPQTLATTSDEFRAWLQEHNVIVYYQLANPQLIPLGTLSELITTEEGINTFFINGNLETTLEVLYARDSEKYLQQYIDDKLATLSQALIKEG